MNCKNCVYYTGVKCHGHGDFWGNCNVIDKLLNQLEKVIDKKEEQLENALLKLGYKEDFIFNVSFKYMSYICYDDTECMYEDFVEDIFNRGFITDIEYEHLIEKDVYKECKSSKAIFNSLIEAIDSILKEKKNEK